MTRVENGEWKTQQDFTIGWDELIKKMNEIKEDLTIDEFLQKNFTDKKYKELRTSVLRFAEGFDLADTSKASVLAIREEWMAEEDEQYRVVGGCDLGERKVRKGAVDAVTAYVEALGGSAPQEVVKMAEAIGDAGGTPLAVADGHRVLGLYLIAAGFLAGIGTDLIVSYAGG